MFYERMLNFKNKDLFVLYCEELYGKCGFYRF